jgi:hypothetical protein
MGIDRRDSEERHARIEAMMDAYRAAERRRIVKRAMALWNRAEAAHEAKMCAEDPLPEKVH